MQGELSQVQWVALHMLGVSFPLQPLPPCTNPRAVPDMKVGFLLVCFAIVGTCSTADPWTGYRGMSLNFQDEAKGERLNFKESSSSSSEENIGVRN